MTIQILEIPPDSPDARLARLIQKRVLRPNGPLPNDTEPGPQAVTVAARSAAGNLVGAATVAPEAWPMADFPAFPIPDWHFRSLAVLTEQRGAGVGSRLVTAACEVAAQRGARGVWAQARTSALGLYLRLGWTAEGPEWVKPGVGPHRYVWRTVS